MAEQFSVSFLLKLIDNISTPLVKVGSAFDEIDRKFSAASKSTMDLGKKMTVFATLPIMGWAAYAGNESGKVNVAFREMGHSLEGLPKGQLDALKNDILSMTTILPRSTQELAEYAEMAGRMNELKDVKGFVTFMSAFTSANKEMNSKEGVASFMDMVRGLQITQAEYGHTGDVITLLGQRLHTTGQAIVQGTMDLSHLKETTKITNEELMAISAWADSFGATGGMAMKQFTKAMSEAALGKNMLNLAVLTKVTGLGANTAEFQKEFEKSPAAMMQKFLKGLAGMKDAGQVYELTRVMDQLGLSGNRVQSVVLRGAATADELGRALSLVTDKARTNGVMMTDAKAVYQDFGSQMTMLLGSINVFAKQFGDDILPAWKAFVAVAKTVIAGFVALPAPIRYAVEGILAFTAAIGPLLMGLAILKGSLAVLGMTSIAALAPLIAMLPLLAAIALAVGAVSAAVYQLHKNWDAIFSGPGIDFIKDLLGFAGNTVTFGTLFNKDSQAPLGRVPGGWFGRSELGGGFSGNYGGHKSIAEQAESTSGAPGMLASKGEATIRIELDKGLKTGAARTTANMPVEINSPGYLGLKFAH